MKKILAGTVLSAIALLSYTLDVSAAAQPISGIDISAKKNPGGMRSEMHMDNTGTGMHDMMHMMDGSGMTASGVTPPRPPKPPMGTGAMMGSGDLMDHDMRGLGLALGQLSPTDRAALITIIREYLASKSITLPTNDAMERKGWDGSVKGNKINTEIPGAPQTLLDTAKAKRDALKAKRDALKAKINDFNSSRSNREKGN